MVLKNCGSESKLKATGAGIRVSRGAGSVYPWAPVPLAWPACKAQSRMFLPEVKEMLWPRLQLSCGCQWERRQVPMGQQNALPEIPLKAGLAILLLCPSYPAGPHYKGLGGPLHDLFPGTLFFQEHSQWILPPPLRPLNYQHVQL